MNNKKTWSEIFDEEGLKNFDLKNIFGDKLNQIIK